MAEIDKKSKGLVLTLDEPDLVEMYGKIFETKGIFTKKYAPKDFDKLYRFYNNVACFSKNLKAFVFEPNVVQLKDRGKLSQILKDMGQKGVERIALTSHNVSQKWKEIDKLKSYCDAVIKKGGESWIPKIKTITPSPSLSSFAGKIPFSPRFPPKPSYVQI